MVTTVKILSVAVRFSLRSMQVFLSKKTSCAKEKGEGKKRTRKYCYTVNPPLTIGPIYCTRFHVLAHTHKYANAIPHPGHLTENLFFFPPFCRLPKASLFHLPLVAKAL